jgi:hypothetical protein
MTSMKIYGVPFSQPVRSVIWLLLLKEQLFQLVPTNPGSKGENGSRHPSYLKKIRPVQFLALKNVIQVTRLEKGMRSWLISVKNRDGTICIPTTCGHEGKSIGI